MAGCPQLAAATAKTAGNDPFSGGLMRFVIGSARVREAG